KRDLREESNKLRDILANARSIENHSSYAKLNSGNSGRSSSNHHVLPKARKTRLVSQKQARPLISVVIPARNEADRLMGTIRSVICTCSSSLPLEIVVVDDASTDGSCMNLMESNPEFDRPGLSIKVLRVEERIGVPR